jgi:hypothetical protein
MKKKTACLQLTSAALGVSCSVNQAEEQSGTTRLISASGVGVFTRDSRFFLRRNASSGFAEITVRFGSPGDIARARVIETAIGQRPSAFAEKSDLHAVGDSDANGPVTI